MKRIFEWFIIIWTGLLVFLVTVWILKDLYDWEIEIIAAIIGFIGTIIGGLITWLGVKKTIESNKSIEAEKIKKEQLLYLYPLKREIEKIDEHIYFEFNDNHVLGEDIVKDIYGSINEDKLFDLAQRSGVEIYGKLYEVKDSIDLLMREIYNEGSIDGMSDRQLVEYVLDEIRKLIKAIEIEITTRENN